MAKKEAAASAVKKAGWFTKLVWAVVIVFTVVVAAAVIVPMFLPWDKIKNEACRQLSQALHRKVTIQKISFNLFSGIEVTKIYIGNAAGFKDQAFISDDKVVLKYRLLPLLFGKVVIKKVSLVKPQILIERNERGKYNYSDLLSSAAAAPAPAKTAAPAKPSKLPVDVVISEISIKEGKIVYLDRMGAGMKLTVDQVNLRVSPVVLKPDRPIHVVLDTLIEVYKKQIPLHLDATLLMDYDDQKLTLQQLLLTVPSVSVKAKGQVDRFLGTPAVDVSVDAAVDIPKALATVPPELGALPAELKVQGALAAAVQVQGNPADLKTLKLKGSLTFQDLGATYASYEIADSLKGSLQFTETRLASKDLGLNISGSPCKIDLKVTNYTLSAFKDIKTLKAAISATLTSKKLVLDKLINAYLSTPYVETPEEEWSPESEAKLPPEPPAPDYSKLIPAKLTAVLQARLDQVVVKDLEFTALAFNARLADRRVKQDLKVKVYKGRISENADSALTSAEPVYSINTKIDDFKLGPATNGAMRLLAAILERWYSDKTVTGTLVRLLFGKDPGNSAARDKISGTLDADAAIKGKGTRSREARKNLTGKVFVQITDAKLSRIPAMEQAAGVCKVDALSKDLELDMIRGTFNIKDQRACTSDFLAGQGNGNALKLKYNGCVDFYRRLDGTVNLRLNPKVYDVPASLSVLKDEQGWAEVDVSLKGPWKKPQVGLDTSKAVNRATDKAKAEAQKKVDEEKKKLEEKGKQELEKKGKELEEKGKELLKGLKF